MTDGIFSKDRDRKGNGLTKNQQEKKDSHRIKGLNEKKGKEEKDNFCRDDV